MADTLRILVKTGARPNATFLVDGVPADLDASAVPAVVATRPDGTALSPALTASHVGAAGTGKYEVAYPPQADVTLTRLDWTGTVGGVQLTLTTWVEAVGAHLFGVAEARAFKDSSGGTPMASAAEADLLAVRDTVAEEFEGICGWSFVPRFARDVLDGNGYAELPLTRLKASRVLSVTVSGAAQPASGYAARPSGVLEAVTGYQQSGGFPPGRGNVAVEYAHGWDRPPGAVRTAALRRAAMLLAPSPSSALSSYTDAAGGTYSFDPAGRRLGSSTSWFGVPSIDAVLNRPGIMAAAGFA